MHSDSLLPNFLVTMYQSPSCRLDLIRGLTLYEWLKTSMQHFDEQPINQTPPAFSPTTLH